MLRMRLRRIVHRFCGQAERPLLFPGKSFLRGRHQLVLLTSEEALPRGTKGAFAPFENPAPVPAAVFVANDLHPPWRAGRKTCSPLSSVADRGQSSMSDPGLPRHLLWLGHR